LKLSLDKWQYLLKTVFQDAFHPNHSIMPQLGLNLSHFCCLCTRPLLPETDETD